MSPHDRPDGSQSPEPDFEEDEDEEGEEQEEDSSIMAEDKTHRASTEENSPDRASNDKKPTKSNAKDPSRPRRKKARRACFACQRAHLTCGDERPCLRCVKRGLQEQCHDGVRKKAKYLHDAPAEALMPGYHGSYQVNGAHSMPTGPGASVSSSMPATQPGTYYPTVSFSQFGSMDRSNSMGQHTMDSTPSVGSGNQQQQPLMSSPTQFRPPMSHQMSPVHEMPTTINQAANLGNMTNPSFEASMFDPNDPSLLNFNIADLNFGNHYGALEFGMLGHMTSGAVNTPEMEVMDMSHSNPGSISYDGSTGFPSSGFPYTQGYQNWHTSNRQSSTTNLWALQHNGMDAYAVADTTGSLTGTSPHSQNQDWGGAYQSNTVSPEAQFAQVDQPRPRRPTQFPSDFGPTFAIKPRRDTKKIYASVTAPYPYTQRFHSLMMFLQKRFPSDKRLRIAKAISSFRPSFIALTKDLNEDDLIFMEQGFQRHLVEYDDAWQRTGTPSIICRRTGEVVSCNKEFSLVTGWRRDVLLGKEPNLNVNFGSTTSGTHTGSSTRGAVTPRIPNVENNDTTTPQAVFLAELMDQDSVVCFWEDFAERAFGSSNAAMDGTCISLIKYKTKDDPGWAPEDRMAEAGQRTKKQDRAKREPFIKTESGMGGLGEQDGKIDMGMTWLVRRDMFDIPMMIVFNFLPII